MDLLEIRKMAKEGTAAEGPGTAAPEAPAEAKADEGTGAPAAAPQKRDKPRKKKPAPRPKAAPPSEEAVAEDALPEVPEVYVRPAPAGHVREADPAEVPAAHVHPQPEEPPVPPAAGSWDDDGAAEDEIVEYLAFLLGPEEYAVKVDDVKEIIRLQGITKVPRAPEFVQGIISLRGVIIPVFDVKRRLGLPEADRTRSTRIVVLSEAGSPQGIIVDRVTGVARLKADGIEPPPAVIGGVEGEYIEGIGRLEGRLLILFNTEKVLAMQG